MPDALIPALRNTDLPAVRAALHADPVAARRPQAVCTAAAHAFQPALALLLKHGADLSAVWRGYRPLHSLIQEDAHKPGAAPGADRLRCLDWMLEHGADPEQPGAWPPARAVVTAAFSGHAEFVKRLRKKRDPFAAAALGDRKQVEAALRADPGFAQTRDMGGLTALQCAAGSRMPGALVEVARMLLDAGAEAAAKTKSWNHDIDAVYLAASAKNQAMFELLLDAGADPTAALTPALWNGTEALAAIALARGARPDDATADDQPLLNNLIRWGAFRQALWLLEQGASPNVADARGWTAVHQAASRGNEQMLQAVLDAGGDASRRDGEGCVPRDHSRRDKILALLARSAVARS